MPVWLQDGGYRTVMVGKYLNGYGRDTPAEEVPPGWSEWYATFGNSTYTMYDYTVNDDGTLRRFGSAPADYQTDVLEAEAESAILRRAGDNRPFFLWFTPLAPHSEVPEETLGRRSDNNAASPRPASRHSGAFATCRCPGRRRSTSPTCPTRPGRSRTSPS